MSGGIILTPEQVRARNRRNVVIARSVAAFGVLVFLGSIARMHANTIAGAAP